MSNASALRSAAVIPRVSPLDAAAVEELPVTISEFKEAEGLPAWVDVSGFGWGGAAGCWACVYSIQVTWEEMSGEKIR